MESEVGMQQNKKRHRDIIAIRSWNLTFHKAHNVETDLLPLILQARKTKRLERCDSRPKNCVAQPPVCLSRQLSDRVAVAQAQAFAFLFEA